MNSLLPKKEEIVPLKTDSLFSEASFNGAFDNLEDIKKLQIINDLVRQTILPNTRPDINSHEESLIGNCHTSVIASIDYLKELNIGTNYRYVLARVKPYEPDDVLSKHAMLLLDLNSKTYQFDPTPFVGYKYGTVTDIKEKKLYQEYVVLDDNMKEALSILLSILYDEEKGLINHNNISNYNKKLYDCLNYEILYGYVYSCAKHLIGYQTDMEEKSKLMLLMQKINKYCYLRNDREKRNEIRMHMVLKQIKLWEEELTDLQQSNTNYKRQIELIQLIIQEKVFLSDEYEKTITINGSKIHMSHMNPRFFYENNFSAVLDNDNSIFNYDYNSSRISLIDKPTDFNCNSSFLLSIGYPGHQAMTKYMYPNPVLNGGRK